MSLLSFLKRSWMFFDRNIPHNMEYVLSYAFRYFQRGFRNNVSFYSNEEIKRLIEEGKSIIRIGDGEIYLMNYGSIGYQDFHPKLRNELYEIVEGYSDESSYIIGLPERYINSSNIELKKIGLLHCWLPLKIVFRKFFNSQATYADAHLFYKDGMFEEIFGKKIKDSICMVVTSSRNWEKVPNSPLKERAYFLEAPEEQAYKSIDSIEYACLEMLKKHPNTLVFTSIGPASKSLVYRLSKKGYIAYDIGRGIEAVYGSSSIESFI